jgi:hypothetical protein
MTRSISPASRPPYSFGHVMPTQPAAFIRFCHAQRRSNVSRSDATRSSEASSRHSSGERFAASQAAEFSTETIVLGGEFEIHDEASRG